MTPKHSRYRDFPDYSPLVKTQGAWVPALVGELRSHMLRGADSRSKNYNPVAHKIETTITER